MESSLFKAEVKVFPKLKTAMLEVSMGDASKWSAEVEDYLNKKFPYLSGDLRPVNFSETDAEEGMAVGTVVWSSGDRSLTIPIIIEEFKLKEPDLAIFGEKIIPLNEEYLNWQKEDGNVGEVQDQPDPTEHMDYVKGLFEVTDTDQHGNPMGVKTSALRSTIDGVQAAIDMLPHPEILPKELIENVKMATCRSEIKEPIDCVLDEIPDKPYHYEGKVLFKEGTGALILEDVEIPAAKAKEYQEKIATETEETSLYFDASKMKDEIPIVKKIVSSGRYNVFVNGKMRESEVFSDLFTIEGSSVEGNSLVYCNAREGNGIAPAAPEGPGGSPGNQVKVPSKYWQYGKIYGIDMNHGKKDNVGVYLELKEMTIPPDTNNTNFVFSLKGESVSHPYMVIRYQEYKLGKDGEKVQLLDARSLATGRSIRCWLNQNVVKPVLANKEKMRSNEYAPLTDTDYDIYMISDTLTVYALPELTEDPIVPESHYKKIFKEGQEAFKDEFTIKTSDEYGPGFYDIKIAEYEGHGGEVTFYGLDKNAAFLYARHYMGTSIDDLSRVKLGEAYRILPIEKKAKQEINLDILDKYRGEWIKTAYMISEDESIKRVVDYVHGNPDKFIKFKLGSIKELVNSVTSVEFADKQNIGSVKDVVPVLTNAINLVGQLLLVSRSAKIDLSENVLARCFKALVELTNEIRGKNSVYE